MILERVLRAGEGKALRRYSKMAAHVNSLEEDFTGLSDAELRAKTDEYRERLDDGETLDDLLFEAFATVREAASRTLGQRHFDAQLMGGMALHEGNIAEMKTGEGKTLVATLPAYLNALAGKGVHVVTVNDYLAKRDSEWMGRVHRFLGLEVGAILAHQSPSVRRQAYAADITYGTNNEFGFDYLRDNMALSQQDMVQRGHHFAVVDEVDSILVDEARTPLIISGPAEHSARWYSEFARIAPLLRRDTDYEVDEAKRTVAITESGVTVVEDQIGVENLYESANTPLVSYLNNALKAKELFLRDRDYIVTAEAEVLIVDEFTGRVLQGRRYNEGLHQAIEAKERVPIKQENQTLAKVTLQNFFRLYEKLSGMTGTAATEAAEFHQTYKLGVVPIPTNRDMIRLDERDKVYKTEESKYAALVEDVAQRHEAGQPMLIGTTSVAKSELLSTLLLRRGVPHEVLNAKQHEREAAIVAQAGRKGAVTVATNMAGRGTDIMLGGNPEFTADAELRSRGLSPVDTPEEYQQAWAETLEQAKRDVAAEHEEVVALGGLYVIGTERHESRRIDNQLRGRSGRQGDPGESRFYLSLQDDLMRMFNAAAVESIMERLKVPDDVPIENKMVSRAILSAQTQLEQRNYEIRKNVLKYDEVLNKQRLVIYEERRRVLEGADLHEQVRHMVDDVVSDYVLAETSQGYAEDWDLDRLWTALKSLYPVGATVEEVVEAAGGERDALTAEFLLSELTADAQRRYDDREQELTPEVMREVERRVLLTVLDRKWREHLYEIDYLQEGIGLRAMGQRDPLVEFQREAYDMFTAMMDGIKEESVGLMYNVEVQTQTSPAPELAAVPTPLPGGQAVPAGPAVPAGGEEPAPEAGREEAEELEAAEQTAAEPEPEEREAAEELVEAKAEAAVGVTKPVGVALRGEPKPATGLQYQGASMDNPDHVVRYSEEPEEEYAGTPSGAGGNEAAGPGRGRPPGSANRSGSKKRKRKRR